jgi:chitin disaccharide deacetylase
MQSLRPNARLVARCIRQPVKDNRQGLILHADDFGMNAAINRGILHAFRHGLLTSASVLMNAPAADAALQCWKQQFGTAGAADAAVARKTLGDPGAPCDLGVHLNLTQGRPLTGNRFPQRLLDAEGRFPGVPGLSRRLLLHGARHVAPLENELAAQIERFLDHGLSPTHLNGHQYVELMPVVQSIIPQLLRRYRIGVVRVAWEPGLTRTSLATASGVRPWCQGQLLRLFALRFLIRMRRLGVRYPAAYFGTTHAGRIDLAAVSAYLKGAARGMIEIGLHPGRLAEPNDALHDNDGWHDPLHAARAKELELLTSPALAELLSAHGIRLSRLADLAPNRTLSRSVA